MARTQQRLELVVTGSTASRMYYTKPAPQPRVKRTLIRRDMLDLLPEAMAKVVRKSMKPNVEVYLVEDERGLTVELKNKKRY